MRRLLPGLLPLLLLTLAFPAVGLSEAIMPDIAGLATDELMFSLCCDMAGWSVPDGYTLEGFIRTDINGDDRLETVAAMRTGGLKRVLVVMLSNTYGYTVAVHDGALPDAAENAADDALYGIDISDNALTLYTYGSGTERFVSTYAFLLEGETFMLDTLQTVRWGGAEATREIFDYDQGTQKLEAGTIDGNVFLASGLVEQWDFTPATYSASLGGFDIGAFPTSWTGFAEMAGIELPTDEAGETDEEVDTTESAIATETTSPIHGVLPDGILRPDGPATTQTDAPETDAPEQAHCALCDGWFDVGEAFDTHVCVTFAEGNG